MEAVSHWATIEPFLNNAVAPGWVDGEDKTRLAAYDMYEAIYWTAPEAFQITLHGQEGEPIFVPSGRKVIETAHRYLAPGLQLVADPAFGTDAERGQAMTFLTDFIRRERFMGKFSSAKLYGIMRGDWMFHLYADANRSPGTRVSIFPLHPGTYFPQYGLGDDITSIIAVHLVEPDVNEKGDPIVHKLTYRKDSGTGGPSRITREEATYPADEWGQPDTDMKLTRLSTQLEEELLPEPITSIPVYHIPNVYNPDFGWGSSEMRGIERLMKGINQSISDEEIALVLEGLGVYTTDAGAPIDEETGEELPWTIAPGRVLELPTGHTFNRVNGISSFDPYQQHLGYLHDQIDSVMGENDITRGRADVQVAESGIALALRMGPLLNRMGEKELIITDVMTQMLFDLRNWFTAYEELDFSAVRWIPTYAEKLPVNKAQKFKEVLDMVTAGIISMAEGRRQLLKLGYEFAPEAQLENEITGDLERAGDPTAARINTNAGALNA